jgi:hypothetical protein
MEEKYVVSIENFEGEHISTVLLTPHKHDHAKIVILPHLSHCLLHLLNHAKFILLHLVKLVNAF